MPFLKGASSILSEADAKTISSFFPENKTFERIFATTVNGYTYANLLTACAGKFGSLVAVQTADGRKFGVHTSAVHTWGTNNGSWINDSVSGFLWSLNEPGQVPWKAQYTNTHGVLENPGANCVSFGASDLKITLNGTASITAAHNSFNRALNLANATVQHIEIFQVHKNSSEYLNEPFEEIDFEFKKQSRDDLKVRVSKQSFKPIIKTVKGKGKQSTSSQLLTAKIETLNVVLFGGSGVGKSSFINSLLSSLNGRLIKSQAVRKTADSVTKKVTHIEVDNTPVTLWDTMGWDAKSYKTGEIGYLLDGNIPDGFELTRVPYTQQDDFRVSPSITDRPHAVIIVVAAPLADHTEYISRVVNIREYCDQRDIMPFLLLTMIDEYDEDLLAVGLQKVYHSAKIRDLVNAVSEKTGVQRNQILPVKNYEKERKISLEIDVLLFGALEQIIHGAIDYITYRMKC